MQRVGRTVRKRRKEGKTDYRARLGFLKSKKPRVVVRKTNRYIIGQLIATEIAQDKIIVGANSKELLKLGWPEDKKGSLKNLGACYLTGFLFGKKSKDLGEGILDMGLQRNVKNSRVYAFLKGAVDAGMEIPHKAEIFPEDEKIKTDDFEKLIEEIKEKIK